MDHRKLTEAVSHSGGVEATARWQGRAKQLEKPSSSRREIGGAGKPYNWSTQEIGGRREGLGGAHSSGEAEQRPWSEGALLFCNSSNETGGKGEMMIKAP